MRIRPARPDDVERVEDYLIGLSPETRRLRFWSQAIDVGELARKIVDVDYDRPPDAARAARRGRRADDRRGAVHPDRRRPRGGEPFGRGRVPGPGDRVDPARPARAGGGAPRDHHVRGGGAAREPPDDERVPRAAASPCRSAPSPERSRWSSRSSWRKETLQQFERRETEAAVDAMRTFLSPRSVAVIGASRDSTTIGGQLFHNLITTEFHGPVYPGEPEGGRRPRRRSRTRRSRTFPGDVDVAFIVVPASLVARVARECGEKGVRGLVVISAGFAEVGGDGPERQQELIDDLPRLRHARDRTRTAWASSTRTTEIRLNGTFATIYPPPGRVGFLSQSGALGLAVMEHATQARARALLVRLGRQQGRRLEQRPGRVLERGPADRRGPAVPRVVRQPAPVRAAGARRRPPQADRRGEDRAQRGGRARRGVAHRRAARRVRRDRRRAVPPGRRDPHGHPRGDVRRRLDPREPAAASRRPRGHRHERRRARDPVRRHVRGQRPAGEPALRRDEGEAADVPSRRGRGRATRST